MPRTAAYRRRRGKKNVMRTFKIDFLSAVDRPAQEGARALLMKRRPVAKEIDDAPELTIDSHPHADQVQKEFDDTPVVMTSSIDGHSHLVWIRARAGETSWQKSADEDSGHDHPWMLTQAADGGLTLDIGESEGHSHTVDASAVNAAFASAALSKINDAEETPMPKPDEKTTKSENEVAALETNLALARVFGGLNDEEREHFATLDETAKAAFVTKSREDRSDEIEKSRSADDVVYTDSEGTEYTKRDDPRFVRLAKRADADRTRADKSEESLGQERLEKRAEEKLAHYPGSLAVRARLLKSVEAIEDEGERTEALAALAAGDKSIGAGFNVVGTEGGAEPQAGSAEARLDIGAKKYQAEHSIDSFAKAYRDFTTKTEEGQALYAETLS